MFNLHCKEIEKPVVSVSPESFIDRDWESASWFKTPRKCSSVIVIPFNNKWFEI